MKADIEKIKEKFGVGLKDKEEHIPIVAEDNGFCEYNFEVFVVKDTYTTLKGKFSTSDISSWLEDMKRFIDTLVIDEKLTPSDNIVIMLKGGTNIPEDKLNSSYYEGRVEDFKC